MIYHHEVFNMKIRSKKAGLLLATVAVSAAVLLSGCDEESASSVSASSASTGTTQTTASTGVQPSGATAEQTSALISSLTSAEIKELVSGNTTLAELEKQRFDLPDTTTTETTTEAPAESTQPSAESAASSQAPASASSTASSTAAPSSYDVELQDLLNQLYAVKARAESGLNSAIQSAKNEYHALPASQQTTAKKLSIVMSKSSQLKSLQSSCDSEVNAIVNKMRQLLRANGQSTALADQALAAYEAEKSSTYSSLRSQLGV